MSPGSFDNIHQPDIQSSDMHRFVWREDQQQSLEGYRMTGLTFHVPTSCFEAIVAMRQNALDRHRKYLLTAQAVMDSFYVYDGLVGADSVDEAIKLQA